MLANQPPAVAWFVLGLVAALGAALIGWSYRRALVAIEPKRFAVLCGLRLAFWLGALLVLAAPTRILRTFESPLTRPLAVLVDRSDSMITADNRQRRRLDDALRRWREMEPAARGAFGALNVFAFADNVEAALAADRAPALVSNQTKLFAALEHVLAKAPAGGWGGVVTLTDGLDTSGVPSSAGADAVSGAAAATGTPLFFLPGRNRYAGAPFFGLREFTVPARTPPRSTFRVEATFDGFQTSSRTLETVLKVNGVARPAEPLRVEAGRRLTAWSAEIAAEAAGMIDIELQVGGEIARAAVRVEPPPSNRILYFQGALDWSYRFLSDILTRDASFELTPVFNFPNPNAMLPAGALRQMPEIPRELQAFEIVILANASAAQFTPAQQTALAAWVRTGGVVLFFTPDDDSSQGFAGSELEKMLPVVFAPPQGKGGLNTMSRALASLRPGFGGPDSTKLAAFAWEPTARVREIFAEAAKKNLTLISPLFAEYAHVAHAKPGADVLARHPTELAADGSEHGILLATQRYGRGQSGVLTTDALWRWKLNQPATERGAEIFWQNLFAWLTRERQFGLAFEHAPRVAAVGQEVSIRLLGAASEGVNISAGSAGRRVALSEATRDKDARVFAWRPPAEGLWEITATDAGGRDVRHWMSVKNEYRGGELSGAPPDEELLRVLASRTGGAVLDNAPPAAWREARPGQRELLAERREALWHNPWVFAALLAVYCAEMLLRRKWKLL